NVANVSGTSLFTLIGQLDTFTTPLRLEQKLTTRPAAGQSGTLTPAGSVSFIRQLSLALSGAVSSIVGTLVKLAQLAKSGGSPASPLGLNSGVITKAVTSPKSGAVSSIIGVPTKQAQLPKSGAVTS